MITGPARYMTKQATCGGKTGRGCGRTIFWRETRNGKQAPFDPPSDCPLCAGEGCEKCKGTGTLWVSHFSSCPKAEEFRRKG